MSDRCKVALKKVLDEIGNPSAVHHEGRRVRGLIETAREQIALAIDAEPENITFTSGASESSALLLRDNQISCAKIEHPCVSAWCNQMLKIDQRGMVQIDDFGNSTVQLANSETGIIQNISGGLYMSDVVQAIGKIDFSFRKSDLKSAVLSAHKIGGPTGVGAVVTDPKLQFNPQIKGGGQEMGRRSGTENILAIVGFGAAMEAIKEFLDDGEWEYIRELRDYLECELLNMNANIAIVGKKVDRLPNTSYFATPGWASENQVIQMDLAGFAISAGSACSSGKVSKSKILEEMGYDEEYAQSGIRVSLPMTTKKKDIELFLGHWSKIYTGRKLNVA